jgi:hypothetical protein
VSWIYVRMFGVKYGGRGTMGAVVRLLLEENVGA